MGKHILVVDSHERRRHDAVDVVVRSGYRPRVATGLTEAVNAVCRDEPLAILVDGSGDDGPELCHALRPLTSVHIAAMCPAGDEHRAIACLQAGADSALRDPLSRRLVAARLGSLLQGSGSARSGDPRPRQHRAGELSVDLDAHSATLAGRPLRLTPTEFRLLAALVRRAGHVVSHHDLSEEVWGDAVAGSPDNVRVYVRYLRRKLSSAARQRAEIHARRGAGYVLSLAHDTGREVQDA